MNFHFLEEMALPVTDGTPSTPEPIGAAARRPTAQSASPVQESQRGCQHWQHLAVLLSGSL